MFKTGNVRAKTTLEVREDLVRLGARSVVFDVEPLVAFWDSDPHALARGVSDLLELLTGSAATGAVVGDQVATDGLLAWRLGYTFVRYAPSLPDAPPGPRVLARLGRLVKPLIFRRP